MRETIFRERQEKVAHLDAITKIVARIFNLDVDRMFGGVLADYAQEVFQETYDADLLRQKVMALRQAQGRIKGERTQATKMLDRLDRLGQYYDIELGLDLKPLPQQRPDPLENRKPSR